MKRKVAVSVPAELVEAAEAAVAAGRWEAGVPELSGVVTLATDAIDDDPEGWRDTGAGPETLAFLQYTSGSTAAPFFLKASYHLECGRQKSERRGYLANHKRITAWEAAASGNISVRRFQRGIHLHQRAQPSVVADVEEQMMRADLGRDEVVVVGQQIGLVPRRDVEHVKSMPVFDGEPGGPPRGDDGRLMIANPAVIGDVG